MWDLVVAGTVGGVAGAVGGAIAVVALMPYYERRAARSRPIREVEIARALKRDAGVRSLQAHVNEITHGLDHLQKGDFDYGIDPIDYKEELQEHAGQMRRESRENEPILGPEVRDAVTRYTTAFFEELPAIAIGVQPSDALRRYTARLASALADTERLQGNRHSQWDWRRRDKRQS